jgi:VCBS repeat-containing protein
MAARTRVNATTTKLVNKKSGKTLNDVTLVTSGDGRKLTITTTGTDADGRNIDSVAVYDKQ